MQKITDLSKYRNKKMLMDEAEKLIDFIFEQAKQGKATHKIEQDIIFGLYELERVVYGTREGQKVEYVILDNRLQLPETHKPGKGSKPDKKKMAVVGSMYSSIANKRTPEDVINSLFQGKSEPQDNTSRIKPMNKRVRASLTRVKNNQEVNATEEIFNWLVTENKQHNPNNIKPIVMIVDDQPSLLTAAEKLPDDRIEVLDLLHATPRILDATGLFYKKHEEKLEFIEDWVLRILQGKIKGVVRGLKQMASKRKLSKKKTEKLRKICNYLKKNQDRMQYDQYLKKGYPIASGVIEGACRHFVKDRMERAGMRWTIKGAQAMLYIRSVYLNEYWNEFTKFRIKKLGAKLYPEQKIVREFDWKIVV